MFSHEVVKKVSKKSIYVGRNGHIYSSIQKNSKLNPLIYVL